MERRVVDYPGMAEMIRVSNGAIAYSQSTRRWGRSFKKSSAEDAWNEAKANCGAADARKAAWGRATFLALAAGDGDAFGGGVNRDEKMARNQALHNCPGPNAQIIVVVHTFYGP